MVVNHLFWIGELKVIFLDGNLQEEIFMEQHELE